MVNKRNPPPQKKKKKKLLDVLSQALHPGFEVRKVRTFPGNHIDVRFTQTIQQHVTFTTNTLHILKHHDPKQNGDAGIRLLRPLHIFLKLKTQR